MNVSMCNSFSEKKSCFYIIYYAILVIFDKYKKPIGSQIVV